MADSSSNHFQDSADGPSENHSGSSSAWSVPEGHRDDPPVGGSSAYRSWATSPASEPIGLEHEKTVISDRPVLDKPAPGSVSNLLELATSLEGRMLDHFRLEKFVGGGGMGAVFRAVDTMLGRTVAVKVLSQNQNRDQDSVRRFQNEAQSAARLDHENIARVYYVGEDAGWNFIVFEFIEGVNVRDLVDDAGPLPLDEAVSYVLQVAEALAHAAKRDVVHRDIKPSNVLITDEGRAKLVDMGLARLHQVQRDEDDLTASGVTLGTFDYISPEQARDPRTADVRSDLYSLGCTFFFMLTGRPPFPEGTVLQKLLSHSGDAPPDPRQFRPDLPDELAQVVAKMLAKQPDQRYQDPSELIGVLLLSAQRLGLAVASRGGTVWISPRNTHMSMVERHLPWAVPALLLIGAVAGLDIFWPGGGETAQSPPVFIVPADTPTAPAVRPRPEPDDGNAAQTPDPADAGTAQPPSNDQPGSEPAAPDSTAPAADAAGDQGGSGTSNPLEELAETLGPESTPPSGADAVSPPIDAVADVGSVDRPPAAENDPAVETPAADRPPVPDESAGSTPPNVLVVLAPGTSADDASPAVDSLEAACRLVRRSAGVDTIELRYTGRQQERPVSLGNMQLTIRAGDGFSPIVVFHPEVGLPANHPRDMIHLTGGRLRLEGIHVEMHIPAEPVDRWSLLRLDGVEIVSVRDCSMTVCNSNRRRAAYHEEVAFIELHGSGLEPGPAAPPTEIDLRDTVIRGEATLVNAAEAVPMRLSWHNGLLISTEELLSTGGWHGTSLRGETISIDLDHVTAIVDKGLCRVEYDRTVLHELQIDVKCSNGIVVTDRWPLVFQSGIYGVDVLVRQILFTGERNFYEGADVFWRVDALADDETREFDFEAWRTHWTDMNGCGETRPSWGLVQWNRLPEPGVSVCRQSVEDYQLSLQPGNPAVGSAPDRTDAGFRIEELPMFPVPLESPGTTPEEEHATSVEPDGE